jgi:hypothetical protein
MDKSLDSLDSHLDSQLDSHADSQLDSHADSQLDDSKGSGSLDATAADSAGVDAQGSSRQGGHGSEGSDAQDLLDALGPAAAHLASAAARSGSPRPHDATEGSARAHDPRAGSGGQQARAAEECLRRVVCLGARSGLSRRVAALRLSSARPHRRQSDSVCLVECATPRPPMCSMTRAYMLCGADMWC